MSSQIPLLSLWNVDNLSHRFAKLHITHQNIYWKTVADIGSGVSDFPEQIVWLGAFEVNAVDPIYEHPDIFHHKNQQTRDAVMRIIHSHRNGSEEKMHAHKMLELLNSAPERFMRRTQDKVHHFRSHHELLDESQDIIFLNNMLKAINDYDTFLKELLLKLRPDGAIYITEYAWTDKFCNEFAPSNTAWIKHLSDDDFDDPHEYYRIQKI